jgi:photosynthetic reaction center H subunit
MVGVTFFGNADLASLAIWGFWIFFAGLIFYLQTENMREGYPLEMEDGSQSPNQGPFPVPKPKTFETDDGRSVTVPSVENEAAHRREGLALEKMAASEGFPQVPTGDPMADGVGPASWTPREDKPELDAHGKPKITPMAGHEAFFISAGRDPRGMPILSKDDQVVGHCTDMWIDEGEQEVRYLEYELEPEHGSGKRLVPMQLVRVQPRWIMVASLHSSRFNGVPQTRTPGQITKLEEEKICAWYAGGTLYS